MFETESEAGDPSAGNSGCRRFLEWIPGVGGAEKLDWSDEFDWQDVDWQDEFPSDYEETSGPSRRKIVAGGVAALAIIALLASRTGIFTQDSGSTDQSDTKALSTPTIQIETSAGAAPTPTETESFWGRLVKEIQPALQSAQEVPQHDGDPIGVVSTSEHDIDADATAPVVTPEPTLESPQITEQVDQLGDPLPTELRGILGPRADVIWQGLHENRGVLPADIGFGDADVDGWNRLIDDEGNKNIPPWLYFYYDINANTGETNMARVVEKGGVNGLVIGSQAFFPLNNSVIECGQWDSYYSDWVSPDQVETFSSVALLDVKAGSLKGDIIIVRVNSSGDLVFEKVSYQRPEVKHMRELTIEEMLQTDDLAVPQVFTDTFRSERDRVIQELRGYGASVVDFSDLDGVQPVTEWDDVPLADYSDPEDVAFQGIPGLTLNNFQNGPVTSLTAIVSGSKRFLMGELGDGSGNFNFQWTSDGEGGYFLEAVDYGDFIGIGSDKSVSDFNENPVVVLVGGEIRRTRNPDITTTLSQLGDVVLVTMYEGKLVYKVLPYEEIRMQFPTEVCDEEDSVEVSTPELVDTSAFEDLGPLENFAQPPTFAQEILGQEAATRIAKELEHNGVAILSGDELAAIDARIPLSGYDEVDSTMRHFRPFLLGMSNTLTVSQEERSVIGDERLSEIQRLLDVYGAVVLTADEANVLGVMDQTDALVSCYGHRCTAMSPTGSGRTSFHIRESIGTTIIEPYAFEGANATLGGDFDGKIPRPPVRVSRDESGAMNLYRIVDGDSSAYESIRIGTIPPGGGIIIANTFSDGSKNALAEYLVMIPDPYRDQDDDGNTRPQIALHVEDVSLKEGVALGVFEPDYDLFHGIWPHAMGETGWEASLVGPSSSVFVPDARESDFSVDGWMEVHDGTEVVDLGGMVVNLRVDNSSPTDKAYIDIRLAGDAFSPELRGKSVVIRDYSEIFDKTDLYYMDYARERESKGLDPHYLVRFVSILGDPDGPDCNFMEVFGEIQELSTADDPVNDWRVVVGSERALVVRAGITDEGEFYIKYGLHEAQVSGESYDLSRSLLQVDAQLTTESRDGVYQDLDEFGVALVEIEDEQKPISLSGAGVRGSGSIASGHVLSLDSEKGILVEDTGNGTIPLPHCGIQVMVEESQLALGASQTKITLVNTGTGRFSSRRKGNKELVDASEITIIRGRDGDITWFTEGAWSGIYPDGDGEVQILSAIDLPRGKVVEVLLSLDEENGVGYGIFGDVSSLGGGVMSDESLLATAVKMPEPPDVPDAPEIPEAPPVPEPPEVPGGPDISSV